MTLDDSLHRARALEFTILTVARSGETLGATWDEIDFTERLWTVPAQRMKMHMPHVAPLCDRALQIIQGQYENRSSRLIFQASGTSGPFPMMPC
jgi:integrase